VKEAIPNDRKTTIEKRGEAANKAFAEARNRIRQNTALAWDASPISTARMAMEIWAEIKDLDWSLVSSSGIGNNWPNVLWRMEKYYQAALNARGQRVHRLGHGDGHLGGDAAEGERQGGVDRQRQRRDRERDRRYGPGTYTMMAQIGAEGSGRGGRDRMFPIRPVFNCGNDWHPADFAGVLVDHTDHVSFIPIVVAILRQLCGMTAAWSIAASGPDKTALCARRSPHCASVHRPSVGALPIPAPRPLKVLSMRAAIPAARHQMDRTTLEQLRLAGFSVSGFAR
jgi:hypothetical protein